MFDPSKDGDRVLFVGRPWVGARRRLRSRGARSEVVAQRCGDYRRARRGKCSRVELLPEGLK